MRYSFIPFWFGLFDLAFSLYLKSARFY